MAVVDDVREAIEQTVPDFSERSGDWAGVLAMAQAGEGDRRGRAGGSQSRRRRGLIVLASAVLVVVVGAASAFGTVHDLLAPSEHIEYIFYPSKGKRGRFTVELRFGSSGTRSWRMRSLDPQTPMTGQYAQVTGGGGRFPAGGHQAAWSARVFGSVSRPGAAKQRVLITLTGRPNGVFVLTPMEPGVLKQDSGTQQSFETG